MTHFLAQSEDYGQVLLWSAVILGLCIAMFFLVSIVRKKARGDIDDGPIGGFTLADLRELHRAGSISDAEFEKAKATLVSATRAAAAKSAAQQSDQPARSGKPPSPT